ncbi:MAG TPA: S1/P1 nuclease [Stellaceae bacterium]|nr:S1/P1 nuclease [Stellaceae bacterium]
MRAIFLILLLCCGMALKPQEARAWSDGGHIIVALIANNYLDPPVRDKVNALLASDTDKLTKRDLASAATWADKYRDSDFKTTKKRYNQTYWWHFAFTGQPCTGESTTARGALASTGPAKDCIVTKINQFADELASPATPQKERVIALKFLLNLVADLHEPIRASDNLGALTMRTTAPGLKPGTLFRYWETDFVTLLGSDPRQTAAAIIPTITTGDIAADNKGAPVNWARQSYELARDQVYGKLPPPGPKGVYDLDAAYVQAGVATTKSQLIKAGIRLATILNKVLATPR